MGKTKGPVIVSASPEELKVEIPPTEGVHTLQCSIIYKNGGKWHETFVGLFNVSVKKIVPPKGVWSSYVLQMIPANGLKAKSWLKEKSDPTKRVVNIRTAGIAHKETHSKTDRMEIRTSDGNLYFTTVDDSYDKSSDIAEEFKKI